MVRSFLRTLYHRAKIDESRKRYAYLQNFDPNKVTTQVLPKKSTYSIAFLIPGLPAHSGGITTIFRLGTYLAKIGHDVTYIDCSNASLEVSRANALINFKDYKGHITTLAANRTVYDIGVCTLWDTAFQMREHDQSFGYKMYFVQDFEPAFYPLGDLHFLCAKTYRFGFHMVSLGAWNAHKITEAFPNTKVDFIDFPIETKIYNLAERTIRITDRLDIAIFVKLEPKRAPDLIPQLLVALRANLKQRGIELHAWIFGTDIPFGVPAVTSMGMLTHDKLQALYHRCHLGFVGSLTNISNVTFEMLASGLPVIEFREGSGPTFFNDNELIFVDTSPRDFCERINYYIDHQDELNAMVKNGQNALRSKTWDKSSERFNQIIADAAR